jgi:single-strand DNA-binding protein
MSVNKIILVGNVGKDPEIRHLDSGVAVANFPLATSESYTAKNGDKVTSTEWHNIVLWRGLAEVAEKYVTKGRQLYVEGRIKTRSFDDKEGNKRYITEVVANVMQMLGPPPDSVSNNRKEQKEDYPPSDSADFKGATEPEPEEQGGDDDLPF